MNLLQRIERRREREQRQAQRWVEKHGVGSMPGRRSETGESAGSDQLSRHRAARDELGREHRDPVYYESLPGGLAGLEEDFAATGRLFEPIMGLAQPAPTLRQLEKRSRMNHVFSFMLAAHIELLYWRHVEGMTLQEIADQEHVSRQAIHSRLKVAEREFRAAFAAHWNDDVTWEV